MQTLHRFRKLIALVALIWLPMTVFAQVCSTQCLVMSMQTRGVFSQAVNEQSAPQQTASSGIISAEASGLVVADSDEHDCDMKAVCAFAALIPMAGAQPDLALSVVRGTVSTVDLHFASYRLIADTPPPRTSL